MHIHFYHYLFKIQSRFMIYNCYLFLSVGIE